MSGQLMEGGRELIVNFYRPKTQTSAKKSIKIIEIDFSITEEEIIEMFKDRFGPIETSKMIRAHNYMYLTLADPDDHFKAINSEV